MRDGKIKIVDRWVWCLVAAIGLASVLLYGGKLAAEPLRLNPTGCKFYAKDANHMALKRDAGVTEEALVEYYEGFTYDPTVKPHLIALVRFISSSSLTPDEAERALYAECLKNDGWIGRPM